MTKMLLPMLLLIVGLAAGVGTGLMLKPEPAAGIDADAGDRTEAEAPADPQHAAGEGPNSKEALEYVKLNNQFVVPVVSRDMISAMIVLSLTVEIAAGTSQAIYDREPKLRDAFLQVLFDHANIGGFEGAFTNAGNMDVLRRSLMEVAKRVVGDAARGVLITDIARQDV